jgi:ribonuclease P protein subunit POP4
LWNSYVSEIVGTGGRGYSSSMNGPILLKADYHGAQITVEDCRCKSRIGITGICIKETKNMFEIVTKEDRMVKIPKEKSLFNVIAKLPLGKELQWRLWGDQFLLRSGERAGKKFSGRTIRNKPLLEL